MIVVDASAVVDVLTEASGSDRVRDRLTDVSLHAPPLLDNEVVSALRGLTLRGHLSPARALDALADYADLPVTRWESAAALRRRAFDLRSTISTISTISAYDAAYVVLAEALGCPLLTRDRRLASAAGPLVQVVVL